MDQPTSQPTQPPPILNTPPPTVSNGVPITTPPPASRRHTGLWIVIVILLLIGVGSVYAYYFEPTLINKLVENPESNQPVLDLTSCQSLEGWGRVSCIGIKKQDISQCDTLTGKDKENCVYFTQQAMKLEKILSTKNVEECFKQYSENESSICVLGIVEKTHDQTLCESFPSSFKNRGAQIANCYSATVTVTGDYGVCEKILATNFDPKTAYAKDYLYTSCIEQVAIRKGDLETCRSITKRPGDVNAYTTEYIRNECTLQIAVGKKDPTICDLLPDPQFNDYNSDSYIEYTKKSCQEQVAGCLRIPWTGECAPLINKNSLEVY